MRHYEIVFMVHPDQSEKVPGMIERYTRCCYKRRWYCTSPRRLGSPPVGLLYREPT